LKYYLVYFGDPEVAQEVGHQKASLVKDAVNIQHLMV
jgi:hypothetical protein